jgi:hypothetical protein
MALFLTIAVGYFIGEMRVAGFSLWAPCSSWRSCWPSCAATWG